MDFKPPGPDPELPLPPHLFPNRKQAPRIRGRKAYLGRGIEREIPPWEWEKLKKQCDEKAPNAWVIWTEKILIVVAHFALLKWIFYVLYQGGTMPVSFMLFHFLGMALFGAFLIRVTAFLTRRRWQQELHEPYKQISSSPPGTNSGGVSKKKS